MLPLIMPPKVCDFKLVLYDLFKKYLLSLLKVISSKSRIIVEVFHSSAI